MRYLSLLSFGLLLNIAAHAQIFINTGNPNIDKYNQNNNTNTTPVSTDTGKVDVPAKTPSVTTTTQTTTTQTTTTQTPATPAQSSKAPKKVYPPKTMVKSDNTSQPEYTGSLSEANNNLPPNAEVGKCYARCFVADKYEFKEDMVIDKPLSYKTQVIPATFKTVFDTVVIKPASVRTIEIPAEYETTVEDIMVSPATQKWVKGSADAGCLSANPADCQVMCLQQVPAVYKKVSRKIVKTPAYKQDIPVAAEYKIVSKQVIDQPSRQDQIEIPATYKKVMRKNLVRKGGYSEWKEILCGDKLTASKIISIQKALKANGYDPGPLDDVFGSQTKAALVKYQQDKNLPVGNLNMETLKSLGVE